MKSLLTLINEKLKVSTNSRTITEKELEFFLDAFGFNDGTLKEIAGINDDRFDELQKQISEWFNEYVIEGVNYYTTASKQTLSDFVSDKIIDRLIDDDKDFCGECDTSDNWEEICYIDHSSDDYCNLVIYSVPDMKALQISIENPMYATVYLYLEGI
jgi:hypothetical protein